METAAMIPLEQQESVQPHQRDGPDPAQEAPVMELTVDLIRDDESFVALKGVWNRLVTEAGIDHPFMRHEWVRTWWDCFEHQGASLHILVVREGNDPIAIAPLMFDHGRLFGCQFRRLRGIANVYTERFDIILTRRAKEASQAIWQFLAAQASTWDILELRQIPNRAFGVEQVRFWALEDKFLLGQWHSSDGPFIPIDRPWESYVKTLSKKHLSNLRGRAKGLHRVGEVRHEIVTGGEQLNRALDEAFLLEAAAWKGKAGTAIMNRADRLMFYRTLLTKAAEAGWLQLHFLAVNGRRIAVQLVLLFENKLYILKSGYDPQYASFGPSLLLCELMLRDAWKRGLTEVDFLGDAERWKLEWAHQTRAHSWVFIFPNRPYLRLFHRLKFSVLPRLQKHAVYRLLRSGVYLGLRVHEE
jgi:CelD/BcsL family acetyltransferase involved in cellulose biosynthesis